MNYAEVEKYFKTKKHHQFSTDFFTEAENYEVWDEIDFSQIEEVEGQNTYEITAGDIKFYAEGSLDDNPLMTDEDYARKSPYGELVPHPLFVTPIIFWCVGVKGRGNWIRTPGARNPGQSLEIYDNFHVGEVIHVKMAPHDRFLKRGKCYLQYRMDLYNQEDELKCRIYSTLILPRTRDDIRKFLRGLRGLTD
jgi:acyl dehydratase